MDDKVVDTAIAAGILWALREAVGLYFSVRKQRQEATKTDHDYIIESYRKALKNEQDLNAAYLEKIHQLQGDLVQVNRAMQPPSKDLEAVKQRVETITRSAGSEGT